MMSKRYPNITPIERFLDNIGISENKFYDGSACWKWTGSLSVRGYGKFSILSKSIWAHRFIYEFYHGEIDPTLTIDHLCRNPSCSNVLHLEQVSLKVNVLRGNNKCAINLRKTHCLRGHELCGDNLYLHDGHRRCKTCKVTSGKEWNITHKEYYRLRTIKYRDENRDEINRRRRELRQIKKGKIISS